MSVAKPSPHDSARLHVTGAAHYLDDLPMPETCLHLAFGVASIAAGSITNLDLADVRAAPGVVEVLSAQDFPNSIDVSPSVHDEPLLSDGNVHYHGQPVFLVIAESHLAARKAARLSKITYSEKTPILTIDDALAIDSRFEEPIVFQRGDAQAKLGTARHRISDRLEIGGQEHFYLEGQAALAMVDDAGDLTVYASSQHPSEIQHKVAEAWAGLLVVRKAKAMRLLLLAHLPPSTPGGLAKCAMTATTIW